MRSYWTAYFPATRHREWGLGSESAANPRALRALYKKLRWDSASWKHKGLQLAHVLIDGDTITVRTFGSLAAANRFHKSLTHPA